MDDSLGPDGLAFAEIPRFKEDRPVSAAVQSVQQPEAGDAAAEDQGVQLKGLVHVGPILRVFSLNVKVVSSRGRDPRRIECRWILKQGAPR